MRRGITTFLTAALFASVLLLTSWHKAHCDGEHGQHDADHCLVCQLATMSAVTPIPSIEPIAPAIFVESVAIPPAFIVPAIISGLPQARAPPEAV